MHAAAARFGELAIGTRTQQIVDEVVGNAVVRGAYMPWRSSMAIQVRFRAARFGDAFQGREVEAGAEGSGPARELARAFVEAREAFVRSVRE